MVGSIVIGGGLLYDFLTGVGVGGTRVGLALPGVAELSGRVVVAVGWSAVIAVRVGAVGVALVVGVAGAAEASGTFAVGRSVAVGAGARLAGAVVAVAGWVGRLTAAAMVGL